MSMTDELENKTKSFQAPDNVKKVMQDSLDELLNAVKKIQ